MLRIALQVWAESLRDPALARFVAEKYTGFRREFVLVAERARQAGELPADADVEAVGAVLFGLLPGYFLQVILTGAPDRRSYLAGLRTLLGCSGGVPCTTECDNRGPFLTPQGRRQAWKVGPSAGRVTVPEASGRSSGAPP